MRDYVAYGAWLSRPPTPGIEIDTWVMLPDWLGSVRGRVILEDGTKRDWGVFVPHDADGALVYVHKADVTLAEDQGDPTS